MFISLNGEWSFKRKGDNQSFKTLIPSCNYQTLIDNGVIEDPFKLDNESKTYLISKEDYIYTKIINIPQEVLNFDKVYLFFNQVDTIATLLINNEKVFSFDDCHIQYKIDVKDNLKAGDNIIELVFNSPVNFVKNAYDNEKTTINCNGQNGISNIRKPQCHFGWDWGPVIPVSGITGDVYIKAYNTAEIIYFNVLQKHKDGKVELSIECGIDNFNDKEIKCVAKVEEPDGNVIQTQLQMIDSKAFTNVIINNPQLWWTKELSNKDIQPLYKVSVFIFSSDKEVDSKSIRIGLRTIVLDRSKDEYGKNFCFVLNGIKIFAKGANFIPADSLINRFKESNYDKLLDAVQFSNMNMIRIWGGGYIGSDYLYDKCDERGILIWQDFPYACMGYPFFKKDFKELCIKEAENVLLRIRHHASLALLCGNNEIEQMCGLWFNMKKYINSAKDFYYNDLKHACNLFAPQSSYIEGTPCGDGYLRNVNSDKISDTHIWAVWHGMKNLKYYRKRDTRFCSEFGFESFPCMDTIKKFNGNEGLDFSSPYIKSHQKCNTGNEKIKYYIADRFNLPKTFKEYVYLSQICQSECIRYGAEYWRQNKGKCNGSLFWQLNDCWPTSSWAAIDYYNNYKALAYRSRDFFNPIAVSFMDTKSSLSVYATNDLLDDKKVKIEVKVLDMLGKTIYCVIFDEMLTSNSSKKIVDIDMKKIKQSDPSLSLIAKAMIIIDEKEINTSCILLNKEKNIKFINPEIEKKLEIVGNELVVTLKNKSYAHFVYVVNELDNNNFSDNFFSMLPNETKIIRQKLSSTYDVNEIENNLSIFSAYDLSKGNKLNDKLVRLSVLMKPKNLLNFLFNR